MKLGEKKELTLKALRLHWEHTQSPVTPRALALSLGYTTSYVQGALYSCWPEAVPVKERGPYNAIMYRPRSREELEEHERQQDMDEYHCSGCSCFN